LAQGRIASGSYASRYNVANAMARIVLFCCVAYAAGLTLRNSTAIDGKIEEGSCQLQNKLQVPAFALTDDTALVSVAPGDEKLNQQQENLQTAIQNYKKEKEHFQSATDKLMEATEALLEVPAADAERLGKVADGSFGKDVFLVVYAPWCPHCQTFVLHDAHGNPANAPLEVLRRDLLEDEATSDVVVMRADVTKLGQTGIPPKFQVQSIPTAFFANKRGEETQFSGDTHSIAALTAFVKQHATN